MPFIYDAMLGITGNDVSRSWRLCFIVPLVMHFLSSACILTGQDLPDGNYGALEKKGVKQKLDGWMVVKLGASNINAWILTLTYGLCFGIELTMNNKAVLYFYTYYGVPPRTAGVLGSCFGLMNLFARSWGGLLSDAANKKFGMRGRLWAMWIVQSLEGVMCILMASMTLGMDSPHDQPKTQAFAKMASINEWGYGNTTWVPVTNFTVNKCGCRYDEPPDYFRAEYGVPDKELIMMLEPPSPWGDGDDCIMHQDAVGKCVFLMICFSLCV